MAWYLCAHSNDSLMISNVEYESPAWNAGLRRRMTVLKINDEKPTAQSVQPMLAGKKKGDKISVVIFQKGETKTIPIELAEK